MIRRKNDRNTNKNEPVDYWMSSTDILTGLLLIVLLIMMLLMLYIVRIPEEQYRNPYEGDHYEGYAGDDDYDVDDEEPDYDDEDHSEVVTAGGGGGHGGGESEPQDEYDEIYEEEPLPGMLEGDGNDKTAVFVMVVDEETGTTIKEKGLTFELYSGRNGRKTLYTYYPVKTPYSHFETTPEGTFYLPEKIGLGDYELHGLNAPKGYDNPENVDFSITESLDWSEAYKVVVSLSPSKNTIAIQVKDAGTGEAIPEVEFEVVAAENIITADGTLRYQKGFVIEELTTNDDGYAESSRLYLGKYNLRQSIVPPFYAGLTEEIGVEVEAKSDTVDANAKSIKLSKTAATIQLLDELYDNTVLEGASFRVTCNNNNESAASYTTDASGEIYLTELEKNATYRIKQTAALEGYHMAEDLSFKVDDNGLIDNEAAALFTLRNRITRFSVGVSDKVLRNQVADVNLTLFDAKDNKIETWNSTGVNKVITGLEPGSYYILVKGDENRRVDIEICDTAEVQNCSITVFTSASIAVIAAGIAMVGVVLWLLIRMIGKLRAKKRNEG